jgi:hypothetical protein
MRDSGLQTAMLAAKMATDLCEKSRASRLREEGIWPKRTILCFHHVSAQNLFVVNSGVSILGVGYVAWVIFVMHLSRLFMPVLGASLFGKTVRGASFPSSL